MRAAMVGGTAYYAGKKANERSQREYDQEARLQELEAQQAQQQQPAYAPPPPAPPAPAAPAPSAAGGSDVVAKLTELKQLQDAGALTQEEFEAAKAKLLSG
jgi:hypothetical protein